MEDEKQSSTFQKEALLHGQNLLGNLAHFVYELYRRNEALEDLLEKYLHLLPDEQRYLEEKVVLDHQALDLLSGREAK